MEMEDYSIAETKNASSTLPKLPLPLLKKAPMIHYTGCMGTPPHHTLASIPFQWEEEPGKPRPCTTIIPFLPNTNNNLLHQPRCLELPPRLLGQKFKPSSSSSPVTVLDGPYYMGRSKFISSSFRLFRAERQGGSFDSSGPDEDDREEDHVGYYYFEEKSNLQKIKKGIFGLTWKRKNNSSNLLKKRGWRKEVGSVSFGYGSSSSSMEEKTSSINGSRRISNVTKYGNGSSSSSFANNISQTGSHFWAAMYEGIKQVIPWKSKKI